MAQQLSIDINLRYLELELARVDAVIRREVRRWQLAGQNPDDAFRGLYTANEEIGKITERSFGMSWGQTISLSTREAEAFTVLQANIEQSLKKVITTAKRKKHTLRLRQLVDTFQLSQFEFDALLICLAPAIDLRYEQIYGFLQDHVNRKRPLVNLVLNLLVDPGPDRLDYLSKFAADAPLIKHHLLKPMPEPGVTDPSLLNQVLIIDPTVTAWLCGKYQPHADLHQQANLFVPELIKKTRAKKKALPTQAELLVPPIVDKSLPSIKTAQPLVAFCGLDRGSQQITARFVAQQLQLPLLEVDLNQLVNDSLPPLQAVKLVLRDALLTGAIPCMFGWERCLVDKKTPLSLLMALCDHGSLVIVVSENPWQPDNLPRNRSLFWLDFPVPMYSQRLALWEHFLRTATLLPKKLDALNLAGLASQFRLTSDQIQGAVLSAKDKVVQYDEPLTKEHLFEAARAHSNPRLTDLAKKITPRYHWDDLILPEAQIAVLREVVNTLLYQPIVLEEWQVGKKLTSSMGVAMLFAGPPGTGKTMAAEVIAGELGLDLYKMDLSNVVSKYIGETEKNLERIFNEAERSNAILFFDEADALFGKRSEVRDSHDRYANIETSYLLQRMEAYDGVTILATNLRANLDEAFSRRLQFAIDFPFPEGEDRLRIWQSLFPETVPQADDLDLPLLAEQFKLAGGNIRNVIVSAAYLAAGNGKVVTMEHLLHATNRELQKMGRLIREDEIARFLK